MKLEDQTLNYQLNCGQYVLHHGTEPVRAVMDEIAIIYSIDREDGLFILRKHGSVEGMQKFAEEMRARYRRTNDPVMNEMADDIQIVQGRLDIDMVNKALVGITGPILQFIKKQGALEVSSQLVGSQPIIAGAGPDNKKLTNVTPLDAASARAMADDEPQTEGSTDKRSFRNMPGIRRSVS